jgi:hypothetical protein
MENEIGGLRRQLTSIKINTGSENQWIYIVSYPVNKLIKDGLKMHITIRGARATDIVIKLILQCSAPGIVAKCQICPDSASSMI